MDVFISLVRQPTWEQQFSGRRRRKQRRRVGILPSTMMGPLHFSFRHNVSNVSRPTNSTKRRRGHHQPCNKQHVHHGPEIGEGNFGVVYHCTDVWNNDLAAKVLKQPGDQTHDQIMTAATAEFHKLLLLRHPNVTYVFDAFEFRDTFYIITERCFCPLSHLFQTLSPFDGSAWLLPIARCILQAVNYLHLNQYAHQDIHLGNVFAAFAKDEMVPGSAGAINFKLGDLGVTKLFNELDAANTLAEWIRPPEAINPAEFGPLDNRIDIYHLGLLFLELALSRELRFTREEILSGRPREMAQELPAPYSFALEKALRRHVMVPHGHGDGVLARP